MRICSYERLRAWFAEPRTSYDLAKKLGLTPSRVQPLLRHWLEYGWLLRSDQQIVAETAAGMKRPAWVYIDASSHKPGTVYRYGGFEVTFGGEEAALDPKCQQILDVLEKQRVATTSELKSATGIPSTTLWKRLEAMVKSGLVIRWGRDGAYGRRPTRQGFIYAIASDEAPELCVRKLEEVEKVRSPLVLHLSRIITAESRRGRILTRSDLMERLSDEDAERFSKAFTYYKNALVDLGIESHFIPRTSIPCFYNPSAFRGDLQAALAKLSEHWSEEQLRNRLWGLLCEMIMVAGIAAYYADLSKRVEVRVWPSRQVQIGSSYGEVDLVARVKLPEIESRIETWTSEEGYVYYKAVPHAIWYIFEVKGMRVTKARAGFIRRFYNKIVNGIINLDGRHRLIPHVETGTVMGTTIRVPRPDVKLIFAALGFEPEVLAEAEKLGVETIHIGAIFNILRAKYRPELTFRALEKLYRETPIERFTPGYAEDYRTARRRFLRWLFEDVLRAEVPKLLK